jgi:cystathionine beta-lyase
MKLSTHCVHTGEIHDEQFKGAISAFYPSTSYPFEDVEVKRYPRYFNTPNQVALAKKMAALELAEAALLFGSGMGAVSNAIMAFAGPGDHIVFQKNLYGGTMHFIKETLPKWGVSYTFVQNDRVESFAAALQPNTKIVYIETPSNPLLTLVDIEAIATLAKKHGAVSMIDNTFATPVNQQPRRWGVDLCIHSATKYFGGHSDILAGVVMGSQEHIDKIFGLGINLGANLSDYTVWLLERSVKTLVLRVRQQNENALALAHFLQSHTKVAKVYYPGLPTHPDYALAQKYMTGGFGGMLSFELKNDADVKRFMKSLRLIKPSMSLAGVESTLLSPTLTSHALLTSEEREAQGISDGLIRFSVGIEDVEDLMEDLNQAMG